MTRFAITLALLAIAFSAAAETTAIVGAKIHTVGPQGTIDSATIIIVDSKIL